MIQKTAAVAQLDRAFAPQAEAEDWVLKSQPRQT